MTESIQIPIQPRATLGRENLPLADGTETQPRTAFSTVFQRTVLNAESPAVLTNKQAASPDSSEETPTEPTVLEDESDADKIPSASQQSEQNEPESSEIVPNQSSSRLATNPLRGALTSAETIEPIADLPIEALEQGSKPVWTFINDFSLAPSATTSTQQDIHPVESTTVSTPARSAGDDEWKRSEIPLGVAPSTSPNKATENSRSTETMASLPNSVDPNNSKHVAADSGASENRQEINQRHPDRHVQIPHPSASAPTGQKIDEWRRDIPIPSSPKMLQNTSDLSKANPTPTHQIRQPTDVPSVGPAAPLETARPSGMLTKQRAAIAPDVIPRDRSSVPFQTHAAERPAATHVSQPNIPAASEIESAPRHSGQPISRQESPATPKWALSEAAHRSTKAPTPGFSPPEPSKGFAAAPLPSPAIVTQFTASDQSPAAAASPIAVQSNQLSLSQLQQPTVGLTQTTNSNNPDEQASSIHTKPAATDTINVMFPTTFPPDQNTVSNLQKTIAPAPLRSEWASEQRAYPTDRQVMNAVNPVAPSTSQTNVMPFSHLEPSTLNVTHQRISPAPVVMRPTESGSQRAPLHIAIRNPQTSGFPTNLTTYPSSAIQPAPAGQIFAPNDITSEPTPAALEARIQSASTHMPTLHTPASTAQPTPAAVIVQQLSIAAPNLVRGPIEVSLSPKELGHVRMTLTHNDGGLTLSIQADRDDTLALLRRNLDILSDDLRDLGFANLSFRFGGDSEHSTPGGRPKRENQADGQNALPPPTPTQHAKIEVGLEKLDIKL